MPGIALCAGDSFDRKQNLSSHGNYTAVQKERKIDKCIMCQALVNDKRKTENGKRASG